MGVTRFGLQIPNFTYPGVADRDLFARVAEVAVTAEESDFDSLWVMDHFYQIARVGRGPTRCSRPTPCSGRSRHGPAPRASAPWSPGSPTATQPCWPRRSPPWTSSRGAGRSSGSARRGTTSTLATAFPSRPSPSAWAASRKPSRSAGRCSARRPRVSPAATTRRAKPLTLTTPGPFDRGYPDPRRRQRRAPHPGPVVRYSDACNRFGDVATVRHKLEVLARDCEAVGRDPAEITKTRLGGLVIADSAAEADRKGRQMAKARGMGDSLYRAYVKAGDPDTVCEQVAAYLDAGLDGMVFNMHDAQDLEPVRLAGHTLTNTFD